MTHWPNFGKVRRTLGHEDSTAGRRDNFLGVIHRLRRHEPEAPFTDNLHLTRSNAVQNELPRRRTYFNRSRTVQIDADLAGGEAGGWPAAEEKQIGLLSCDISDFTTIAEGQLAYDLVHSLNRFFKQLGDPILANYGVINKYLGDGMLALFGLESPTHDECARQTVRASLRMLAAAQNLNGYLQDHFGFSFEPRIGLHYGSVLVGQLGHPDKIDFTVIGDAVNTASRIEASNKNHGTRLLASEDLVAPILPSLEMGRSFEAQLRGRSGSVRLFEILGFLESDPVFLVQSTFEIIAPKADAFATDFYRRLFALHPEIELLFVRVEMTTMRLMLMRMIGVTVRGLHNLPTILPDLRALGMRHSSYGVRPEHFDFAEDALLHALTIHLAEAFRPEVQQGWRDVFGLIRRACSVASPKSSDR